MTEEITIGESDVATLEAAGIVNERARQKAIDIAAADDLVERLTGKRDRIAANLASTEEVLAEAIAAREELD